MVSREYHSDEWVLWVADDVLQVVLLVVRVVGGVDCYTSFLQSREADDLWEAAPTCSISVGLSSCDVLEIPPWTDLGEAGAAGHRGL